MAELNKRELEDKIVASLKTVHDPEIPVDIFELGLIYAIHIRDDAHVDVDMTLTSPSCPEAEKLPGEVERAVASTEGVKSAKVTLTFDPPWDKEMMSEEAKLELGFI
jgi:FeS assembly SUF system protein